MSVRPSTPPVLVVLSVCSLLAGCASPENVVGFREKDPAARMRAIRQAAATRDQAAIPELIRLLESDDPAERLLAIRTLEELTGETLGYDHAAGAEERRTGAEKWGEWYRGRSTPKP